MSRVMSALIRTCLLAPQAGRAAELVGHLGVDSSREASLESHESWERLRFSEDREAWRP